jgi:hypothetical protein
MFFSRRIEYLRSRVDDITVRLEYAKLDIQDLKWRLQALEARLGELETTPSDRHSTRVEREAGSGWFKWVCVCGAEELPFATVLAAAAASTKHCQAANEPQATDYLAPGLKEVLQRLVDEYGMLGVRNALNNEITP